MFIFSSFKIISNSTMNDFVSNLKIIFISVTFFSHILASSKWF